MFTAHPVSWLEQSLEQLRAESLLREPKLVEFETATTARVDGAPAVVFCGNDYLGLRRDPGLARAAQEALSNEGSGAGASRLVCGNLRVHEEAEQALAQLVGRPAALLASSGYAANVGCIAALVGADDVVFSDALNHASIVDGCRLSRARIAVFAHADPEALERAVRAQPTFRRGWVITESLFSMDGDMAPLAEIRAVADRYGLQLYVDEAHAVGVFGESGEGLACEAGVRPDVLLGTLGKALGGSGAFVAGEPALRAFLWNRCRAFVFSTGVAPSVAAVAVAAARYARGAREQRAQLRANVDYARGALREAGITAGGDGRAPIVSLVVGDAARTVELSQALLHDGVFVQAIRPPTVPVGTSRLRISLSAAHSREQIDQLVSSLRRHV